jgi:hypothetical protein
MPMMSSRAALGLCLLLAAAPAAASSAEGALLATLGPGAAQLIGPARIGALFGVVTSGFRTVEHNRRVGGVRNSFHLTGRALDVQRRPGVSHQMVDAALRRAGFVPVESIDEIDHSHFAFAAGPGLSPEPSKAPVPVTVATAPAKPLPPRVVADEHGVLLIDSSATP